LAWEEVRGHSKKAICGLGIVHLYEVSWCSSDFAENKREVTADRTESTVAGLLQFLPEENQCQL
jgi:hypothetical protein